jgi:hypothetical protein
MVKGNENNYTLNIVLYMYSTCACMSACTLNTNYTGTMQDVHKSHTCTCTLNMLYGESVLHTVADSLFEVYDCTYICYINKMCSDIKEARAVVHTFTHI